MNPFRFFLIVLRSALLSSSGLGNVPLLHDSLVPAHLATSQQFAEAISVGNLSPGPNGLWVICLGIFVGGLPSAFAALIGISLPPLLVLPIKRIYHRIQHNPAVQGLLVGLQTAIIAVFVVVLSNFLRGVGHQWIVGAIVLVSLAVSIRSKLPVPAILGGSALVGLVLMRS